MERSEYRRRMARQWLLQSVLAFSPVLLPGLIGRAEPGFLGFPLFCLALASLFVSLPLFQAYKRALLNAGKQLNTEHEGMAWTALERCRRRALYSASLPVWIGTLGLFIGMEWLPWSLLAIATAVLFHLYRLPRQLFLTCRGC